MNLTTEIVIDIRPEAEFLQGHQQGSVYFDGVAALSERQYELPEPQQVMTIVHGSEQIADLLAWIQNSQNVRFPRYKHWWLREDWYHDRHFYTHPIWEHDGKIRRDLL